MDEVQQIPRISSDSFYQLLTLVEEAKGDAISMARGKKVSRTRLRTKMSQIANLCRAVRKEVPPAGKVVGE
jgi:hypothetical protein